MLFRQLAQLADRRLQQPGIAREGDVLGLHRGIDADPGQVALVQRSGVMGDAQAFGQQNAQAIADPLAPMAHA